MNGEQAIQSEGKASWEASECAKHVRHQAHAKLGLEDPMTPRDAPAANAGAEPSTAAQSADDAEAQRRSKAAARKVQKC